MFTTRASAALSVAVLVLVCYPAQVAGHGFMSVPQSRNWLAGYGPDSATRDYCPHCYNGGSAGVVKNLWTQISGSTVFNVPYPETEESSKRHGLCGDMAALGGGDEKYLVNPSTTVATYKQGQVIDIEVVITAHHRGHFEFSICDLEDVNGGSITQTCLNKHILERADDPEYSRVHEGYERRYYLEPMCYESEGIRTFDNPVPGTSQDDYNNVENFEQPTFRVRMQYKLPANLTCTHCVMQWWWITANSCNPDNYRDYKFPNISESNHCGIWWVPGMSDCSKGGWPEEFWNCADITIEASGPTTPAPPAPPTTTGAITTAPATTPPAPTPPPTTTQAPTPSPPSPPTSVNKVYNRWVSASWNNNCQHLMNITFPYDRATWELEITFTLPVNSITSHSGTATGSGLVWTYGPAHWNDDVKAGDTHIIDSQLSHSHGETCPSIQQFKLDGIVYPEGIITTTQAPTTQAPTTQAPTTQAPTTQAPTTQAPTTQAPTTQAPTTQAPTTQAPTTQAPTTQAPPSPPPSLSIKCGTGTTAVNGACEAEVQCASGTSLNSAGQCVAECGTKCGAGTILVGTECVPEVQSCGPGTVESNGECIPNCAP